MLFGGSGSPYLVRSETYSTLRVAIVTIAILIGLFFLFGVAAVVRARRSRPKTGKEELVGETGRVVQDIDPEGFVKVHGELWKAESRDGGRIPVGEKVRIVEIRGLKLIVEKTGERREE